PTKVLLGDNSVILGTGIGHVSIQMKANGKWSDIILQDVLYIPELHGNLLFVLQLICTSANVCFTETECQIYKQHGNLICEGHLQNNMYIM
ncbi:hypothetical protein BJV74DRAFT_749048, partial [Russula compacta]